MAKQRIEYIDAMRGFTMILVVYSHICHFCFGDSLLGFNAVFFLFRLPCFFFISGWLFETMARKPFWMVARRKMMVQLVPTFIFLFLLAPPPEFFHQLGALKGGYWFTFVLFEFFILYMLAVRLCRKWDFGVALLIALGSFVYSRYYHVILSSAVGWQVYAIKLLGFLSVVVWRYFLFFYIGAWVRRHFEAFVRWTDKPMVVLLILFVFSVVASTPHKDHLVYEMLRLYVGGISGMWMVFCFFRLSASWLQRIRLSKPLQYVGTRTLDIYMLHYFFLPRFLISYMDQLQAFDSSVIEFVIILSISLLVLGVTLITSYVIRLNHFLGHYLFGVDYQKC